MQQQQVLRAARAQEAVGAEGAQPRIQEEADAEEVMARRRAEGVAALSPQSAPNDVDYAHLVHP